MTEHSARTASKLAGYSKTRVAADLRPETRNPRFSRRAFTLVEMMTTVAVLVIVLGLMVSLARDVRTRSAERLTKDLLRRLDILVGQYLKRLPEGQNLSAYPVVEPLVTADVLALAPSGSGAMEQQLLVNALANNRDLVRALRTQVDLSNKAFSDLSIANYNEVNVMDPWGRPIVYMPSQHPLIGMAAGDRYFFFSAGPDRKYLTRQDNIYSYESGNQ